MPASRTVVLEVPFPPSVNHYWRRVGPRTLVSREGRRYRQRVCALLQGAEPLSGRLKMDVTIFPPDRRRRDLDNTMKALLDALEHAGVYRDDSQIDELTIRRGKVCRPRGEALVQITEVLT